jgi:hypothetical protein
MKSHRTVRVGPEFRARLFHAAQARGLTLSDGCRACAILGAGGNWDHVDAANNLVAVRNAAYREMVRGLEGAEPPTPTAGAHRLDTLGVVNFRLPKEWNERLRGVALKRALLAGLPVLERGVR